MNAYMPNHLVHYVPTTNASTYQHIVYLVHNMYLFYIVFHRMVFRSTTTFLLASQLHKYICMYVTCQVPCVHLMNPFPQHHLLKAHSNMWARL